MVVVYTSVVFILNMLVCQQDCIHFLNVLQEKRILTTKIIGVEVDSNIASKRDLIDLTVTS